MKRSGKRLLFAVLAAAWTAAYLAFYLIVLASQGGDPAYWYLAILGAAIVLLGVAALRPAQAWPLVAAVALLGVATLLGLLTIGLLLMPAVLLAMLALAFGSAREAT